MIIEGKNKTETVPWIYFENYGNWGYVKQEPIVLGVKKYEKGF